MRIRHLKIDRFRCILSGSLSLGKHTLLVGENNVGKTTILEAINLALGPDRTGRVDAIDEHDFHLGQYRVDVAAAAATSRAPEGVATVEYPEISIEIVLDGLTSDEMSRFRAHVELWNEATGQPYTSEEVDTFGGSTPNEQYVLRVTFKGRYDADEDEFRAESAFSKTLGNTDGPTPLSRKDKQVIGFLYLRAWRTATRAASLERGSLLDILLDTKDARPRVWNAVLDNLQALGNALGQDSAFQAVLTDLEARVDRFLPAGQSGSTNRSALLVSDLTRRELRGVMTYFLENPEQGHLVPLTRLGNGTTNVLVLALLSAIAETKANVIFGMEEPETALPPHTQRRILKELSTMSAQTITTSHSPYIAEQCLAEDILVLKKRAGIIEGRLVSKAGGIEPKSLRREFRRRYAEGLMSRAVLAVEGISDAPALAEVNAKLAALSNTAYVDADILGLTVVPCDGSGELAKSTKFFKELAVTTFVMSDNLSGAELAAIEAATPDWHVNLPQGSLEELLRDEAAVDDVQAFLTAASLRSDYPRNIALPPASAPPADWVAVFSSVLACRKGEAYAALFLSGVPVTRLPPSLVGVLARAASWIQGRQLYKRSDPLWGFIGTLHPDLFETSASPAP